MFRQIPIFNDFTKERSFVYFRLEDVVSVGEIVNFFDNHNEPLSVRYVSLKNRHGYYVQDSPEFMEWILGEK